MKINFIMKQSIKNIVFYILNINFLTFILDIICIKRSYSIIEAYLYVLIYLEKNNEAILLFIILFVYSNARNAYKNTFY